ncbi:MAG TPA: hypothetical protein VFS24_18930 [Steroidobacteraceae bacterium]|nr:hypothetical protein [Steroidobacteraceae bacterium]
MHKVDSFGATVANEFTDGSPPTVPRTTLQAKFMNAVQRELVGVVEQVGIALSDTDDGQLKRSCVLHVQTITALRNAPAPVLPSGTILVITEGSAALGDGGGRIYYWDGASAAADNGSSIIRPSTNPATGRWISIALALAAITGGAPLDSPAFTGVPTAPTAAQGTNNTQLATTAYVRAAITALINSSPAALDTLQELAAALGNDANFATTVTNALAAKAPLASPALTGTPTAPTAGGGTNTTQLATTAFVQGEIASKAPLASPALTGAPTAPTAGAGTNTTQLATTAFVQSAISTATPSGTYTPAVGTVSGMTSVSAGKAFWTRQGNIVDVFGQVTYTPSATTSSFYIPLPVASDLTATDDLSGGGSSLVLVTQAASVKIEADTTNNRALVTILQSSFGSPPYDLRYFFRYVVQ